MTVNVRKKIIIGLRLEGVIGRRILSGILRYLDTTGGWDIQFAYGLKELLRLMPAADGILVDHLSDEIGNQLNPTVPVVRFNTMQTSSVNRHHAFVHVDDGAIGFAAARYFLGLGSFRSFGFIPAHGDRFWSKRRGAAFSLHLKKNGLQAQTFESPLTDPEEDLSILAKWIGELPKPTALFVAWDGRAVEVLEACRRSHVRVPRQAVVLGVDNDEIICEHTTPPLSSIAPDTESAGFEGARLLDDLMTGCKNPKTRITLTPVKSIVERTSTHAPPPAAQLVQRALSFIDKNATSGIRPDDVARHLGISRSLMDLRLREMKETSAGDRIREAKLAALAKLLRHTCRPMAALTRECGFPSVNAAKETFHNRFGMSMRDYRFSGWCRRRDSNPHAVSCGRF